MTSRPSSLQLARTSTYLPLCLGSSSFPYLMRVSIFPEGGTGMKRCSPAKDDTFTISRPSWFASPSQKPRSIASLEQHHRRPPKGSEAPIACHARIGYPAHCLELPLQRRRRRSSCQCCCAVCFVLGRLTLPLIHDFLRKNMYQSIVRKGSTPGARRVWKVEWYEIGTNLLPAREC